MHQEMGLLGIITGRFLIFMALANPQVPRVIEKLNQDWREGKKYWVISISFDDGAIIVFFSRSTADPISAHTVPEVTVLMASGPLANYRQWKTLQALSCPERFIWSRGGAWVSLSYSLPLSLKTSETKITHRFWSTCEVKILPKFNSHVSFTPNLSPIISSESNSWNSHGPISPMHTKWCCDFHEFSNALDWMS